MSIQKMLFFHRDGVTEKPGDKNKLSLTLSAEY